MNENVDISKKALLENEGNVWINRQNKQIRYSISENSEWIVPVSTYQVGNDSTEQDGAFIMAGQPVSIGYIDELRDDLKLTSDPCVVPTNPSRHEWCIGLAGEPGNADNVGEFASNWVHVLSSGQYTYKLNDDRPNVFSPPKANGKFVWTYDDIGKPVYISNNPGDWPDQDNPQPGGLTLDIGHAYFDGANIVSIGRLANAPTGEDDPVQEIVIEIQPSGDVRGFVDSTQFAVTMSETPSTVQYTGNIDRLIFIKIVPDVNGNPIGHFITDDLIMTQTISNTPVGAFVAKPNSGVVNLAEYAGKTIVVQRLGILEGNFNFTQDDIGKEVFLSNGMATTSGSANSYEYKVGVIMDTDKILIDCRFPRTFASFNMVGDIKPAYANKDSNGEVVAEAGFVLTIPDVVHKVSGVWSGDTQCPEVNFEPLLKATMYKGIYLYHAPLADLNAAPDLTSPNWVEINGDLSFGDIAAGWFRFKDVYYKIDDNKVITQIKYNQEGAPEDMTYIWPSAMYTLVVNPVEGSVPGGTLGNSNLRVNITQLVEIGQYMDDKGKNVESYYIEVREAETNQIISPGFRSYFDKLSNNGQNIYHGYEWAILNQGDQVYLEMVTIPTGKDGSEPYHRENVLGITFPEGQKLTVPIELKIFVRRRPVQYHNLFLNQLAAEFPWAPHTDANNLVTEDTLYFGRMTQNPVQNQNDNLWNLDTNTSSTFSIKSQPAEVITSDSGTTYKYWKTIDYNLAPHNTGNNTTAPIYKLVERYTATDWDPNTLEQKTITWIYDFESNTVSLDAEFAPKLLAPTTAGTKQLEDGTFSYGVTDHGNYNTNSDGTGYENPRSALKTLHEVPTSFYNYSSDLDTTRKKIGPIQDDWTLNLDNNDVWKGKDYVRQIFGPKSDGSIAPGTTYSYVENRHSDVSRAQEWDHIIEEIDHVFEPIKRDASGVVLSGGDLMSYQSNLGLLNQAAKETQDRLLRLERAMFGVDAPTLPNGTVNKTLEFSDKYQSYEDSLTNDGVLRLTRELLDSKVIENVASDPNQFSAYSSSYYQMYLNMFGDYDSEAEWQQLPGVDLTDKYENKLKIMWIWYQSTKLGVIENLNNTQSLKGQPEGLSPIFGGHWQTADVLAMRYPNLGNNYTGPKREGAGYSYSWPLDNGNVWLGPSSPYKSFWTSDIIGVSDDIKTGDNWTRTYGVTSVEGVVTDIMLKLSHIRNVFEPLSRGIKPSASMYNHYPFYNYDDGSIKLIKHTETEAGWAKNVNLIDSHLEFEKHTEYKEVPVVDSQGQPVIDDNTGLQQVSSVTTTTYTANTDSLKQKFGDSGKVGEYAAFGFYKDKIDTGYSLHIKPRQTPNNFSNVDRNHLGYVMMTGHEDLKSIYEYWETGFYNIGDGVLVLNKEFAESFLQELSCYANCTKIAMYNVGKLDDEKQFNKYSGDEYNGKYDDFLEADASSNFQQLIETINGLNDGEFLPLINAVFGYNSGFSTSYNDWTIEEYEENGEKKYRYTGAQSNAFLNKAQSSKDVDSVIFFKKFFINSHIDDFYLGNPDPSYSDEFNVMLRKDSGFVNDVFIRYRDHYAGQQPLNYGGIVTNGQRVNSINDYYITTIDNADDTDGKAVQASVELDLKESTTRIDRGEDRMFVDKSFVFLTDVDFERPLDNAAYPFAASLENITGVTLNHDVLKYSSQYNFAGLSNIVPKVYTQELYSFTGFASPDLSTFPPLIFSRKNNSVDGSGTIMESIVLTTADNIPTIQATENPGAPGTYLPIDNLNPIIRSRYAHSNAEGVEVLAVEVAWNTIVDGSGTADPKYRLVSINAISYETNEPVNVASTVQHNSDTLPNVFLSKDGSMIELSPTPDVNVIEIDTEKEYQYTNGDISAAVTMTVGSEHITVTSINITGTDNVTQHNVDWTETDLQKLLTINKNTVWYQVPVQLNKSSDTIVEYTPNVDWATDRLKIDVYNKERTGQGLQNGVQLKMTTSKIDKNNSEKTHLRDSGTFGWKDSLGNYKLYGINLPEYPDVAIKLKAKEHITDQIHLVASDLAYSYPKDLYYKFGKITGKMSQSDKMKTFELKSFDYSKDASLFYHNNAPIGQQFQVFEIEGDEIVKANTIEGDVFKLETKTDSIAKILVLPNVTTNWPLRFPKEDQNLIVSLGMLSSPEEFDIGSGKSEPDKIFNVIDGPEPVRHILAQVKTEDVLERELLLREYRNGTIKEE